MIYIYDILVNFSKKLPYDFYEWNKEDEVMNIKKIKLVKVTTKTLKELLEYESNIEKDFLLKIYNTCELYNRNKTYNYAFLLSDGNRVIAINCDKEGNILGRSKLLLDEETEIAILANSLDPTSIKYNKKEKLESYSFITRNEIEIYKFLYNEIESSYRNKEYSKLKYLYQEYFDKDIDSNKKMCDDLLNTLDIINDKHKYIYNILINVKKQV